MARRSILQMIKNFIIPSSKATPVGNVVLKRGSEYFYTLLTSGNANTLKDTTTLEGQAYAYNNSSAVNTVINRKVRAHINGIWSIKNIEGVDVGDTMPDVTRLLKRPNALQSFSEFNSQMKLMTQVFGECLVLPLKPVGMDNSSAAALWVIPNWMWTVKRTGKFFQQTDINEIITHYEINNQRGTSINILPPDVIHVRDLSMAVSTNSNDMFGGQSRLYPLKWAIWNMQAAMEARNTMITRRGAIGILSNESIDIAGAIEVDPEEKKEIQDSFQDYGLTRDQWQVIITNAKLKWQSMVVSTKELMLFEEVEGTMIQIADAFDVPPDLFGTGSKDRTYENVKEARKGLYQDAIIPESLPFAESFTNWLLRGTGTAFDITFDHLEVFQKAKKDQADAIKSFADSLAASYEKGLITKSEWRSFLEQFIGDDYTFDAETPLGEDWNTAQPIQQFQLTPRRDE